MTVLQLSEVLADNEKGRLDSGYFEKTIMCLDAKIRSLSCSYVELGETAQTFRKGIFDIKAETYADFGVPFIRISNLREGLIDETEIAFLSQDAHDSEIKTKIERGDLVLSKTAYPAASYVQLSEANVSQDVIAYRISTQWKDRIRTGFLAAYLNSDAGLTLMKRQFQGNVQLHLSLGDGQKIPVPLVDLKVQKLVEATILNAHEQIGESLKLLEQAEQTLLSALGLADWTPPEPLTYRRTAKDVMAARRLDAEYFNPAKKQVLEALGSMPGAPLRKRLPSIRNLFDPKERHTPYQTRNFDLPDALQPVLDDTKEVTWSDEAGSTKKLFQPGDVVISRLRAYLREIAVVRTDPQVQAIGSTEFIVLRPPEKAGITAETLWAFLRSSPVQTVLKWCIDGSQHPRFSEGDLLDIPVPDAVLKAGPKVDYVFKSAVAARQHGRQLLDRAKHAVEIAIETSEAAALAYLEKP